MTENQYKAISKKYKGRNLPASVSAQAVYLNITPFSCRCMTMYGKVWNPHSFGVSELKLQEESVHGWELNILGGK